MTNILLVEDEPGISSFVSKGLQAAGFQVTAVNTGHEAIDHALSENFDLMILDIGLPDMDGFQVIEHVRGQGGKLSIIVLTARTSLEDTVTGLTTGADDYMSKPFRFEELLARIRLRLRPNYSENSEDMIQLTVGGVHLNLRNRRATVDGKPIDLSARELNMLQAFMEHPDQVLSRSQLLDMVWGYDFDPGSNVIDVYVRYLRRKIGSKRIVTVRGMGYRLIPV